MNDKQIRHILVEYLKTKNAQMRIYHEKSIGTAVCDLMVVSDRLTGYEIKSDVDDFRRLPAQVLSYSRIFDENYVVVGKSHVERAAAVVPPQWGILTIEETAVQVEREATLNPAADVKIQLELLWKLELKNLLVKSGMPSYTYKSKEYIRGEIAAQLPVEDIHAHIVYELLHRDYSAYDATDYTEYFENDDARLPAAEIVDTLSEQNLDELSLDRWIELYRRAKEVRQSKEEQYKSVSARPAHRIPYTDIEVSPGVPWVSQKIISDFVYYLAFGKEYLYPDAEFVNYEPVTGHWHIERKTGGGPFPYRGGRPDWVRMNVTYGIEQYNALQIFEAMLNLREIKLRDRRNRYDEKATLRAQEKRKDIDKLFKEWIWQDEDRRWTIEEAYNSTLGAFKKKTYDGSALAFPEMSDDVELYPYQRDAVQKILDEKNTLLAFDVGAGKTYIMIAAAMRMRQMGLSLKNLFVVPNHIVGQWELIFKEMYPTAKVLAIEPRLFKPDMRQKVLRQIRDGDYDGIIMAYSCFEQIPLSATYLEKALEEQLHELERAVRAIPFGGASGSHAAISREEEHVRAQTKELLKTVTAAPDEITFDRLEIHTLFLDEAHNYKNIPLRTNLRNLRGINVAGSKKCLLMMEKVRCIQQSREGRGAVFATGTPLCNSLADAYTMQMYLQADKMKELHLDRFDNWVKTFAKPEIVCEIDVNASAFRFVERFSRFFNLPELSAMFSDIAVFHAMDGQDGLPTLDGYDNVEIERGEELADYMGSLCERTDKIRAKQVDPTEDNMLKVSTDGRKAALDLRLVGEEQEEDDTSKLICCKNNALTIYNAEPDCAQIIFCDVSTPHNRTSFNVYTRLKELLCADGVNEREIAFIHSFNTEERKVELFKKVNEGKVRFLIGSTFKLGTGANVQSKLKAIHHLDVPWRPSDMVQREGRILRKGNENDTVRIFRYITKGSFDAYSWQILETKQKFISQFLTGSTYERSATDLEENVLTYAQVKALALSDERMRLLAEKENERRQTLLLSSGFADQQRAAADRIPLLEKAIASLEERRLTITAIQERLCALTADEIARETEALRDLLPAEAVCGETPFPAGLTAFGFALALPETQNENKPFFLLCADGVSFEVESGASAAGNARRIVNLVKKPEKLSVDCDKQLESARRDLSNCQKTLQEKNPYTARIEQLTRDVENLKNELNRL